MKLYQAIDKLDNTDSFFLIYPDGYVATMLACSIDTVKRNASYYLKDGAIRFKDAIDPVLVAEWN